jgi:lipoprotein-anchoring transpeptidase ErfK/SrfK
MPAAPDDGRTLALLRPVEMVSASSAPTNHAGRLKPEPCPEAPVSSNATAHPATPPTNAAPLRLEAPAPATTNAAPALSAGFPRPVQDVFEAQVALTRQALSPGSLDGLIGPQTRAALRAFQGKEGLAITGELDAATKERLLLSSPPRAPYTVTTNDLSRLQPLSPTWAGKARQTALEYETILELVAEKSQASPNLIRRLNPSLDWTNIVAGTVVQAPATARPAPPARAAFLVIHLADRNLEAFDAETNLLAHFPCSIAQRVEKRPVGELHVAVIAPNPNYTFNPEVFPESAEARQITTKLVLPPGPNNPVGIAWIGLDKPGYGIHGTPSPELVGRTESHGCFRLANWNAEYLLRLVAIGTPVYVEP